MNERRFERIAERYLADGPTVLADRVLDAALEEVHLTRQRRVLWRARWRFPNMNTFSKVAVAAVAVIAVGYLGLTVLRPGGPGAGGGPSALPSATVAPTATLAPTPSPSPTPSPAPTAPPLTGQFTSDRHGFSIAYPEGWTTRPATAPWTAGYLDFGGEDGDLMYDPVLESNLFLAIASQPLDDQTPETWLTEMWQMVVDDEPASVACQTQARAITIGGAAGSICRNLALVTDGGRGYWILAYTSGDQLWLEDAYDDAWFASVLATMELHPEDASDEAATPTPS